LLCIIIVGVCRNVSGEQIRHFAYPCQAADDAV